MKNIIIVILLVAGIALGAFCIQQQKQIIRAKAELADAQNQLAQKSQADDAATEEVNRAKILQSALTATTAAAGEQSKQIKQLKQSLATTKTNTASANPFAAMFKDPKMREMIKSSQKAVMGPMIEKQYSALFKQLNLTPDQAANLKDLLQKKMLAASDAGMSMMDGSLDAAQRADLAKQIKSETDDYDAQIKQYLGDDNYSAFQNYEKTIPDRTTVSQFNDQLGGTGALTDDQQQQLIQAMNQARTDFKWTTDYNDKTPPSGDYAAMFTDDKINQFTQEKEQFDQQFLAQARQILTPEQATAFEEFQKTQRELQIAGMKMAAQMFAPKGQ
jgi:hypothetical protein